jgi:MFS family permease
MEPQPTSQRSVWRDRTLIILSASLVTESLALWGANGPLFAMLAMEWSGSPMGAGIILTMTVLPHVFLGPLTGSFLDRACRRNTLLFLNLTRAAVVLGLMLFVGNAGILYVASLALAVSQLLGLVARGSLVPALVDRDQLQAANGMLNGASTLGRVLGPAVMGAALDSGGPRYAYIAVAAPFLLASLMLLFVPRVRIPRSAEQFLRRTMDGVRHTFRTPLTRLLVLATVPFLVGGAMLNLLELLLASDVLRAGATGYGAMLSMWSCGSLVGALGAAAVRRGGSFASFVAGAIAMGAFTGALYWADNLPFALAMMASGGVAEAFRSISATSMFQAWTPKEKLPHVLGVYAAVGAASMVCAYLVESAIVDFLGIRPAFLLAAALVGGSALLAMALGRGLPEGMAWPK